MTRVILLEQVLDLEQHLNELNGDSACFLTMKETDQEAVVTVVQRVARMCQHLKHL